MSSRSWSSSFEAVSNNPARESSPARSGLRSEEHTSELQSPDQLVCRLLLEKKKEWAPSEEGALLAGETGICLRQNVRDALDLVADVVGEQGDGADHGQGDDCEHHAGLRHRL